MMIAAITPDTTISLMLVALGITTGTAVWNTMSNRKQRREINFAFDPAAKTDFERHVADNKREHELLFKRVNGVEEKQVARCDAAMNLLRSETKDDLHNIHNRINDVLEAVAEVRGELKNRKS